MQYCLTFVFVYKLRKCIYRLKKTKQFLRELSYKSPLRHAQVRSCISVKEILKRGKYVSFHPRRKDRPQNNAVEVSLG